MKDDAQVRAIQEDYRTVEWEVATRKLLDFAVKATLQPRELRRSDVETLREVGFDDATILDAVQTVGYFNYSNRVMDALGIQPEPDMDYAAQE